MAQSLLPHTHYDNPKEIWEILKKVHCAHGFATQLALCCCFLYMYKCDNQPRSSWVSDVKNILALTEGLSDTFSMLIVALDSILPHNLDLSSIVTRLLNEEMWQRNNRIGRPGSECNNEQALIRRGHLQGLFTSISKEGDIISQTVHFQSCQQLWLQMGVTKMKMRLYLLSRLLMTMKMTLLEEVCWNYLTSTHQALFELLLKPNICFSFWSLISTTGISTFSRILIIVVIYSLNSRGPKN